MVRGEGETEEMGNDCYLVIWKEFKIWVLKDEGRGIQTLDQLTARWIKVEVSERKKKKLRQKECEKPRSCEKMFGAAPQCSGWLKERQTRKGATSATEHVQFKKKDCGREVSRSRDQRAHYPCISQQ